MLENKCAGQPNLKTVYLKKTLASGNFLAWSSSMFVCFCSALSTTGRRWKTHLYRYWGLPPTFGLQALLEGVLGQEAACQLTDFAFGIQEKRLLV